MCMQQIEDEECMWGSVRPLVSQKEGRGTSVMRGSGVSSQKLNPSWSITPKSKGGSPTTYDDQPRLTKLALRALSSRTGSMNHVIRLRAMLCMVDCDGCIPRAYIQCSKTYDETSYTNRGRNPVHERILMKDWSWWCLPKMSVYLGSYIIRWITVTSWVSCYPSTISSHTCDKIIVLRLFNLIFRSQGFKGNEVIT